MTRQEIIEEVKSNLKIFDTYHDKDLNGKLDDTINYLYPKGIDEDTALTKYPSILKRGVMDLYNYDSYTKLFNDMLIDASLEEGTNNA